MIVQELLTNDSREYFKMQKQINLIFKDKLSQAFKTKPYEKKQSIKANMLIDEEPL